MLRPKSEQETSLEKHTHMPPQKPGKPTHKYEPTGNKPRTEVIGEPNERKQCAAESLDKNPHVLKQEEVERTAEAHTANETTKSKLRVT